MLPSRHSGTEASKVNDSIAPFVWAADNVFAHYYKPFQGAIFWPIVACVPFTQTYPTWSLMTGADPGWNMYHAESEWKRMGLPNDRWRISKLNASYDVRNSLAFSLFRSICSLWLPGSCASRIQR